MRTLLVASGGGHLQQLISLLPRMGIGDDVVWATPDSGLSRDHLAGQEWRPIPYIPARDVKGALRLLPEAHRILRDMGVRRIISTGAAPAPPFFLAGAARRLDLHFIETATRSQGPSASGKLVAKLPSAHLYTQYPALATGRWRYEGSIFDPFSVAPSARTGKIISKVVVSLGTEKFGFRRAAETLLKTLPPEAEVLWQTGATDVTGLPIKGRESVPASELRQAIAESDLFVCHSGTGSALTAFELGKTPLLLPREAKFGEHIDDHQALTANELTRRGLAVAARVGELEQDHLRQAAEGNVGIDSMVRPFRLVAP